MLVSALMASDVMKAAYLHSIADDYWLRKTHVVTFDQSAQQ